MLKLLKSKHGEGYIDVCVLVLCAVLVIALAVKVFPVFIAKNQLDTFATELCREAEISGKVGSKTSLRNSRHDAGSFGDAHCRKRPPVFFLVILLDTIP